MRLIQINFYIIKSLPIFICQVTPLYMQQQVYGNPNYPHEPAKQQGFDNPAYNYQQGQVNGQVYNMPMQGPSYNQVLPVNQGQFQPPTVIIVQTGQAPLQPYNGGQPVQQGGFTALQARRRLQSKWVIATILAIILIALGSYIADSIWFYGLHGIAAVAFIPGFCLVIWIVVTYLAFRNEGNSIEAHLKRSTTFFAILMIIAILAVITCIVLIVLTRLGLVYCQSCYEDWYWWYFY